MGLFRFAGSQPQVYMDRSLEVAPGDEVEWGTEPPADGLWEQVGGAPDPASDSDAAQSPQKTQRRTADPSGE